MIKRIVQFFESIVYAGLKPSGGQSLAPAPKRTGWFGSIQDRFDRFLNKGGNADPLYLSNRTAAQKARVWLLIGLPSLVLLAGLGLVMIGYFDSDKPVTAPPVGLTDAEIAQKMLPNIDLHVEPQRDVDVQDVHILHAGSAKVAGVAVNKTNRALGKVEIVFELTDKNGSRQGAVSTELVNLPANGTVPFQFPIDQDAASFALVREIHTR